MKFIQSLILLLFLSIILNSCGSFTEAGKVLRNEKKTTDEFLIQKKDPLSIPPDFDKVPVPGSIKKKANSKSSIERILKTDKNKSANNQTTSSSTEKSILKQIKK